MDVFVTFDALDSSEAGPFSDAFILDDDFPSEAPVDAERSGDISRGGQCIIA